MRRQGMGEAGIRESLLKLNQQFCQPPLPEDEVGRIAANISRYEPQAPPPLPRPDCAGRSGRRGNNPLALARLFLKENYTAGDLLTLRCQAQVFLEWRGNAYCQKEGAEVRAEIYRFLEDTTRSPRSGPDGPLISRPSTKRDVDLVIDALRAEAFLSASVTPPAWLIEDASLPPALELLPCKSCSLHLPVMRRLSPTPALFATCASDVDYDPAAPEPLRWLAFLNELWGDDKESIATLQQWFGYCLTSDTRQQKMLLLVGPRRSGKGTVARVLTTLLGQANVVAPTTSGLATQFGLQPLIGKNLAIVSDARFRGQREQAAIIERLLCISGEDAISISRKYLEAVTLKLPTRFMFLTNELPRLTDISAALAGRFIILVLKRSFFGKEDLGLVDKLLNELPAVLNWAVKGWQDLRQQGRFEQPPSSLDVASELEDLSSPVKAFVRDCCSIGAMYSVSTKRLYRAWRDWCKDYGREHAGTAASFGRDLRAACPHIARSRPRGTKGERFRLYTGVGLTSSPGPDWSLDLPNESRTGASKGSGGATGGEVYPGGPRTDADLPLVEDGEVEI